MKKLFIINLLVVFLLLSGCTAHTPITSIKNNSGNPPGMVCRTIKADIDTDILTSNSAEKVCTEKTAKLVGSTDMPDLVINIKDCDTDDYETSGLGKTTNDDKKIRYHISGLKSSNIEGKKQGEIEQCISLDDGKISTDWYFKIKNCDALFNCSLIITNDNSELIIGPFTNDYGILYLTNKRGIEISQSNMPGVAVATTGELHKIRIGQKYYLSNTLNPSDRLIQSLEEL